MKHFQKLLLLLVLLVAGVQSAWAVDEIYARINTAYHYMEIHYDDMRLANMTSDEISILAGDGSPGWWGVQTSFLMSSMSSELSSTLG